MSTVSWLFLYSPYPMKTITKIEQQKKRKNRISVFLDGAFFCGIPEELLAKLDLFLGKQVDENEMKLIIDMKLIQEGKQKVIRLFSRRMYSEKEVVDKLKAKGYEEETVSCIVDDLKRISLINDLAFARAFVADRLRLKPSGSFKISYDLKQRGVSQSIIERVFSEDAVVEGDSERAFEIAKRRLRSLSGIKDKRTKHRRLYNFLLRRGFSYEVIRGTLDLLFNKRT